MKIVLIACGLGAVVWFSWMFRYDVRGVGGDGAVKLDRWTGRTEWVERSYTY